MVTEPKDTPVWVEQLRLIVRIGVPVGISTVLRMAGTTVDIAFIGHYGKDELAAATYCTQILWVMQGIVLSCGMAMIVLSSQARGTGNLALMGSWNTIGMTMGTTAAALSAVLMAVVTDPLITLIDKDRAELASNFGWIFYWWLPLSGFITILRFTLQTWHNVLPAMTIAFLTLGLSVGLNDLFMYGTGSWDGFGFRGSAVASVLALVAQILALSLYTWRWSKRAPQNAILAGIGLHAFTKSRVKEMAFQSMQRFFVISMQMWSISLPTMFLSGLDADTVAAGGIMANVANMLFALFWGWGAAVQVLGAQHIGRGDERRFFACVKAALGTCTVLSAVMCSLLYFLRHEVVKVFSSNPDVKRIASEAVPYMCIFTFVMGAGQVFNGCLDACCLNAWRFWGSFSTLLVLGIPASVLLALETSLELKGLWIGLTIGAAARLVVFAAVCTRIDAATVIQKARERQELIRKAPGDIKEPEAEEEGSEGGEVDLENAVAMIAESLGSGSGIMSFHRGSRNLLSDCQNDNTSPRA
eukprot:Hpha_TRINITY_DN15436_c2_g1::TRINITY_DN15436_c2_g1_i1::g.172817::m.172817/K03327/TC.MATE, SLC47A, norM, mdtK, dinF; multidrug resistance protein, MATE family